MTTPPVLLLAHRGYHESAPENTLEAFSQARSLGVDGIETDVRIDAEGIPILFHDRLAPDGRPAASLPRAELSQIVGYAVPTLQETLERGEGLLWNLEIKTPAAAPATATLLRTYAKTRQFLLTSFCHPIVEQLCQDLEIEGGLLVAHRPLDISDPREWLPASKRVRTIVWDFESCDAATLALAARAGIRNMVYGAGTRAELVQLTHWPVAGVITDCPNLWPTAGAPALA